MFGMADLVTCYVIRDGLQNLASNPDHCRYILGGFTTTPLSSLVARDHIEQAVKFVTENAINVAPYYELDMQKRPSVAVVSSGGEDTQFIGDFGSYCVSKNKLQPEIYAEFDAKSIEGDEIRVPRALKLEDKIWINVIVTNGTVSARVKGILVRDGEDTVLLLDKDLPDGTTLKDWKAQSLDRQKGLEIHSSMDKVTVQVNLSTTGQASVHRLLALIIRYTLKRGRQQFEAFGLQVPTFSYTPLMLGDADELEFQTVFTIETKVLDSWIDSEFDLNDDTKNLVIIPVITEVEE